MTTGYGVLWDMDGVLVDSGEFHFRAWSQALSERDIPFSRDFFQSTFGMNNTGVLTTLLERAPTPELVAEIGDHKELLFRQAARGHAQPLPGARAWLENLQAAGARQAIASSAPLANIDALVDGLDLRRYFNAIVSGADLPGKPDPAVFLQAAREIGVPTERCVVVEDAVAGVKAARAAGMRCVAVTTTNPASALGDADVVVERLGELAGDVFGQLLMRKNREDVV